MRLILLSLFMLPLSLVSTLVSQAADGEASKERTSNERTSNAQASNDQARLARHRVEKISRETEATWKTFCAHCHGNDGRPQTLIELPMPDAPDFSQSDWVDYEVDDLASSISDGTGQMPAFKGLLSQAEIRNLSALVIRFPKGRAGTLIAKRWDYRQRDKELRR